jgi:pimeloyl-ACP methyl ester carboxylesterase
MAGGTSMDHIWRMINQRSAAGVAYDLNGRGPAVLLLHGLSFDRRTWTPVTRLIGDRAMSLVVDLPGHGSSASWSEYDFDVVIDALHDTVTEVGLSEPVVVGHSISGLLAFVYAARYPTTAVIDVDMVLDLGGFAELVRSLDSQLHSPAFPQLWEQFEHSMQLDHIPADARQFVDESMRADQQLVLGYWAPLFDTPVAELSARVDETLAAVSIPCAAIHGSELEASYRRWLRDRLPQIAVHEWPNSGHFPHLVQPERFTETLLSLATNPSSSRRSEE